MALDRIRIESVIGRVAARQGRRWGPCPACNAEHTRHDSRPPIVVVGAGLGWACYACEVTGDAYDLVSWSVLGVRARESGREFPRIVAWIEGDESARVADDTPEEVIRPDGVASAIRSSRSPSRVPVVSEWLERRGIDPGRVPAGVLDPRFNAPWWPKGWAETWKLVVPAFTGSGTLASLQARAIEEASPRCRWPAGCSAGGLLFADPLFARPILRGEPSRATRIMVVEGLTDYLSACSSLPAEHTVAVIGIASGSASALRLIATPTIPVIVATDYDRQGEVYAGLVAEALSPCPVHRLPYRMGQKWI